MNIFTEKMEQKHSESFMSMWSKSSQRIVLFIIVVLAFFLRFIDVSSNPPSLNWDEVSIGYNAFSILQTGRDEYGNYMPLSIRSFDDYKPPVYIYLTVPSVAIFGLTEFAVRFPAVIFGTLSVFIFYLLISEVLKNQERKTRENISLISAFFLAVSPWHLQFSRAAYEGNIGLFFLMAALYFFFISLRNKYYLIFSSILFILSVYSYHSFRLIVPLILLVLLIIFFKELWKNRITALFSAVIFIVLVLPVFLSFVNPEGSKARLSMVSIFVESGSLQKNLLNLQEARENNDFIGEVVNNRRFFFAREMLKGYFDHFSPNFLFVTGANSNHHHAFNFGMMYLWDLPFLLAGIYFLSKRIDRRILVMFLLLLLAPLPASITTGTPHGVRAISLLPSLVFLVGAGFYSIFTILTKLKNPKIGKVLLSFTIFIFIINFVYYLHQYHIETPRIYGYFWGAGNKEAIEKAKELDNSYSRIIMTYKYDQPYIYYLFYNKIDPFWYQSYWKNEGYKFSDRFNKKIGKYEFRNIDSVKNENLKNTLLIGTPDEISGDESIYQIHFPDGNVAYRFKSIK